LLLFRKLLFLSLICAVFWGCSLTLEASVTSLDRVTFFGDSTTAHLSVRGGIPQNRVWSGAGSTVLFETVNKIKCVHLSEEGRDVTLAQAVQLKRPQILVITIGVSGGAGVLPKERFIAIYREMLDSVRRASPSTKILVQSILPLSDRSVKHYRNLTKASVEQANGWIKSLCREMGIPYLDTHALLIDPSTGYLKAEYQNDEYMHLTAQAYEVILANLRAYAKEIGY
jgi:lysophospholipase L1-like esterase